MGVCCVVFDIDGMLLEYFMNFLNIENFVSIFQLFFAFHAICNIFFLNSMGGGGGGGDKIFF